jgi:hypothetical protein
MIALLLFICGDNDPIIPVGVSKVPLKKCTGPAMVEYKQFPGRAHHIVGWVEAADYSLSWVEKLLKQ